MMVQQPMYLQIADDLRRRIELGAALPAEGNSSAAVEPDGQLPVALRPGSKLPPELALGDVYSASRNTVRDAIKRLVSQGLVEARQGQGTFVTMKVDPFVTILSSVPDPDIAEGSVDPESATYLSTVHTEHRVARVSTPKVEIQTPAPEVAARLRLLAGKQVVSRHQERYIDGLPWSLQTSFYPMEFVTKAPRLLMADDIEDGTVRYLKQAMNLRQTGYRDWITARAPDENEQKFFGLAHDATVFVIFRTGFDQTQTPMRVTVTIFPADRNQFIVDSGDVPGPEYRSEAGSQGS
jgi:GntR family transcriptional regulator